MGGRSMKDVGGAVLAGSTPPFLGRERAAVNVDVGPERRSPRYHETCLALESIKEGSAAVSEPRRVRLRVHIFKDLEKARRLPVCSDAKLDDELQTSHGLFDMEKER